MENKNLIATALRMIGKNIILIADCICKEEEPEAVTEEKPKKKIPKKRKSRRSPSSRSEPHLPKNPRWDTQVLSKI